MAERRESAHGSREAELKQARSAQFRSAAGVVTPVNRAERKGM